MRANAGGPEVAQLQLAGGMYTVKGLWRNSNIRGNGKDHEVIGSVPPGTVVQVFPGKGGSSFSTGLFAPEEHSWVCATVRGKKITGWIRDDYLKPAPHIQVPQAPQRLQCAFLAS